MFERLCSNMQQSQLKLDSNIEKSIQVLYRKFSQSNTNVVVTFLSVQKQRDGYNCGLVVVAFAVKIFDGKSPIDAVLHVPQLCNHFVYSLENGALI